MQRLQQISNHLMGVQPPEKHPDDVVIVAAYRTAMTRGGKGKFKDINSDELLMKLVKGLLAKTKFPVPLIEEVAVGNVLNPGAGVNEHRAAIISAGIPAGVPFIALNRQCSSGLMAVNDIANKVKVGQILCGLACGVESMSKNYGPQAAPHISESVLNESQDAKDCLMPMGTTSENVNEEFVISREDQDQYAARSYQKAENSVKNGLFKDEILPITVDIELEDDDDDDDTPSQFEKVIVDTDEGPRPNVTAESLSKLRPAFKKDGGSHAGNSSQVSDGAAAIILMRRDLAQRNGIPILGKYVATAVVGVPPGIMGVGPGYAIPKLLEQTGYSKENISVFEINEAFAGQTLFSIRKVGIPIEKVNPRGGAIALGHPLGCTGTRQVCTLLRELSAGQFGVTSMCIGGGQGAASLFIKE